MSDSLVISTMKNDHYPFLKNCLLSTVADRLWRGSWVISPHTGIDQLMTKKISTTDSYAYAPGPDVWMGETFALRFIPSSAVAIFSLYYLLFLKIIFLWHIRELCPLVSEHWREAPYPVIPTLYSDRTLLHSNYRPRASLRNPSAAGWHWLIVVFSLRACSSYFSKLIEICNQSRDTFRIIKANMI